MCRVACNEPDAGKGQAVLCDCARLVETHDFAAADDSDAADLECFDARGLQSENWRVVSRLKQEKES